MRSTEKVNRNVTDKQHKSLSLHVLGESRKDKVMEYGAPVKETAPATGKFRSREIVFVNWRETLNREQRLNFS